MRPKRNGRFGRIQCQRGEESSSRGKRRVFLCRRTVEVKVEDKAIPSSFLNIEGGCLLERKTKEREREREREINRIIGRWSEPWSCSTSQEQERAREEGAKEMSGEKRLPEERWTRVGVSGSLRGRKSEEMTQSNTSSLQGLEVPLESQRG